ncbi:MAG: LacI family DNA-binding transcriptional regulator [Amaricoccus sp.]|uniref:LacI family DNA-binding transcriptional regulator n=1 Tax=Amaricoccus sp. TaxID=1872485 RepID=UPI0039E4BC18
MAGPTFADIARAAGVGTATVERVLNGRGGVRPATVERVLAAARSLDYPRRLPDVHRGLLRIEVILVRPETTFYRRLSRAFERIAATLDPVVRVHRTFADEADPPAIAALIASGDRRAGLILAVPDHPAIRAAVEGVAPQLPLVHVVTRAHPTLGELVAIDNYAAGRTAAHFLARMQGRLGGLVAIGHPIYQVHRERLRGFSDCLALRPGGLDFRWIGFGGDDARRCGDLVHRALETWPDLAGVYNVGAGNRAVADVLRRHPRGAGVFCVGHELSDATAEALRDGAMHIVLDQAPEAQARRAIDLMLSRLGLLTLPVDTTPIRFVTVTAESV